MHVERSRTIEMQLTHGSGYTFHCFSSLVGPFKLVLLDSCSRVELPLHAPFPHMESKFSPFLCRIIKVSEAAGSYLLILRQGGSIDQGPGWDLKEQIKIRTDRVIITSALRLPWFLPLPHEMECSGTFLFPHSLHDS